MMADEIWKEMPGTDYSVSSEGRIASRKQGKWRILKPHPSNQGYLQLTICMASGYRKLSVHRLVAAAFLGPQPTPKHNVNHKNGVRTDNRIDNLEWTTPSENQRHRFDVLKHNNTARGEAHGKVKLTELEVWGIRACLKAGESERHVAARYGVTHSAVRAIVIGRSWRWLA